MTEEEKKAIESVKDTFYEMPLKNFKSITLYRDSIKDVFILLTSFEKLQEENKVFKRALDKETADRSNDLLELQKKDKIIDLMAEYIEKVTVDIKIPFGENMLWDRNEIKQLFKKLAKEKGE